MSDTTFQILVTIFCVAWFGGWGIVIYREARPLFGRVDDIMCIMAKLTYEQCQAEKEFRKQKSRKKVQNKTPD